MIEIIKKLVETFSVLSVLIAAVLSVILTVVIYPSIAPIDDHSLLLVMLGIGIVVLLPIAGVQKYLGRRNGGAS